MRQITKAVAATAYGMEIAIAAEGEASRWQMAGGMWQQHREREREREVRQRGGALRGRTSLNVILIALFQPQITKRVSQKVTKRRQLLMAVAASAVAHRWSPVLTV